jgi:hypothetical protein
MTRGAVSMRINSLDESLMPDIVEEEGNVLRGTVPATGRGIGQQVGTNGLGKRMSEVQSVNK